MSEKIVVSWKIKIKKNKFFYSKKKNKKSINAFVKFTDHPNVLTLVTFFN